MNLPVVKSIYNSLEELTGFEYAVLVQSGSAAQRLVMSVILDTEQPVSAPALGCWTIANTLVNAGFNPSIKDIDSYWGLDANLIDTKSVLMSDCWSVPSNWVAAQRKANTILDLTLAPGGRADGKLPGEILSAGYLSLGVGKPLNIGAGGVALFNSAYAAREARRLLKFCISDGRWIRSTHRYVFAAPLIPILDSCLFESIKKLPKDQDMGLWLRDIIPLLLPGFRCNDIRPGCQLGLFSAIPLVLPEKFPLTPQELEAPALMSGLSLTRHPIGVPHREAAWRSGEQTHAPFSEALASRLIFFEPSKNNLKDSLDMLRIFIDKVMNAPDLFKMPYSLSCSEEVAIRNLRSLPWGEEYRICKGVDRKLYVYDEVEGFASLLSAFL